MSIKLVTGPRMANGIDLIPHIYCGRYKRQCWAYLCFWRWSVGVRINAD